MDVWSASNLWVAVLRPSETKSGEAGFFYVAGGAPRFDPRRLHGCTMCRQVHEPS
jgi:hypothetical protein